MRLSFPLRASVAGVLGSLAFIPAAFAQEAGESGIQDVLFFGADILNLVLVAAAIMLITLIIGRYGASELSTIFTAFIIAAVLLGACRLFLLLAINGVYELSDEGLALSWHLLFYMAMGTFILGARSLVKLSTASENWVTPPIMNIWAGICAVATLAIFTFPRLIDDWYVSLTGGTVWESFGTIHFGAFLFAGISAFYVYKQAKTGPMTKVLATPLLFSIGFLSIQHFWEVVTEAWKLIDVAPEVIEEVEILFVVPAYLLFAYAFLRLYRFMTAPTA